MSALYSLVPSLESIDFQKTHVLFDELTMAIAQLRKQPSTNRGAVEQCGITKIIFHHTGINLDGEYCNNYFNASILPPFVDARSPLLTYITEGLKVQNNDRPGLDHTQMTAEGTIDLANSKVTGVFQQLKGQLYVGSSLFDALSDREIAAIILHEVGHQFAYFEYIVHTCTLAVNLNYCATQLAEVQDKEQRVKIIINTSKNLGIEVQDPEALASSKDFKTPVVVLMETYTRQVRSGTRANYYDYRSWEALADQFATRQGAGRDLVVGLDKIMRMFGAYGSSSVGAQVFAYFAEVCFVIVNLGLIIASFGFMALFWALVLSSPFPPEGTYDNPKARLTRVKNELIGALKDKSLPVPIQKTLQDDIACVDTLIEGIGKESGFVDFLWRNLTAYRRENYRQVEFQAELEKLANNELYLASSKLKTLSA